jgi:urease accessory protein
MIVFTKRFSKSVNNRIDFDLALTAEQRTRSRQSISLANGKQVYLQLPRGTLLSEGDLLKSENSNDIVKIIALAEPVLTIFAHDPLQLIRAAYHLGNRHIPVEITSDYLRISPDSVLQEMLIHLGLNIQEEVMPFYPEPGAYHHH